ncbi:hypothetical protein ESZ36_08210 [Colwellia demingiae]|uniref:Uncharacterized protein n=1 Tax=Colwellia demingiae TaxID=89401 RepID=A0A5C6QLM6_9GAMM|nr:hypothetical protein [Colwellia demingiae]TWX69905.1 hypothetical protein ESZ36_08210 [Colwellia demingiae]
MDLEELICKAPGTNSAFTLPNESTLLQLIEKCKLIGITGYIDLEKVDMGSLSDLFSEFEIIVLTNVETLNEHHELLYRLSCLLDFEEPYVLCVVSDINKFNKLQHNKAGPLYLRWYWINDFGIFPPK